MSRWTSRLVRLYPRRWREQYEAELTAVIEDSDPGWRTAADVLRGAALMQFAYGLATVRHHARRLIATPAFTLTALATLSLAIGANTLIFSLVHALLLTPLPFPEPDRLVGVSHVAPGLTAEPLPQGAFTYFTYREAARQLEDIGLWNAGTAAVSGRGDPEVLDVLTVTDGTLPILRVAPVHGRGFTPDDDAPGSRETVLVSRAYWMRALGGNPRAIGQSLLVDGRPREVIGVLPDGFQLLGHRPDLVLPLRLNRAETAIGLFRFQGLARLAPGVTREAAAADLARLIPSMPDRFPIPTGFTRQMYDDFHLAPDVHPLQQDLVGDVSGMLWLMSGAVGLLLLVACANVASLFLVRAESRRQEIAVQLALGAPLTRVAGQILGEALLLSVASGVAGLAMAAVGLQSLRALALEQVDRMAALGDVTIAPGVVLFTLLLALAAGALFSLAPILKYCRPHLATALKEQSRGSSNGRESQRLRNGLVIAQVAVALVLLVGAALMVRTFLAIRDVHPGFSDPGQVLTVRLTVPEAVEQDPATAARAHDAILRRIRDVGGVQSVAQTSSVTMDGAVRRDPLFVEGIDVPGGGMPPARRMKWVSPDYFATMGNRVVAGRDFHWDDVHGRRPVAIVSARLARETFGDVQAALGRRVRTAPRGPWREVVGVVGDEHDDGPTRGVVPLVYWPYLQEDMAPGRVTVERTLIYVIRTMRPHDTRLLHDIQQAVWAVSPTLPLTRVESLQAVYDRSTAQVSSTLVLLVVASVVTLLLGVVGLYGVIAYMAAQRRREVGIRMALGAEARDVERLFLARGLGLVGAGLVAGIAVSTAVMRTLEGFLYQVAPFDPVTYLAAATVLGCVATVAIWVPARAAARLSPVTSLRL
ncbi:MAG: ABC transporter permease [Vicinamibacterales bacterium]